MNSLPPRSTLPLIWITFQRLRSIDWMEVVGLPCAAAIMEAQPLILVLWLAGLVLTGKNAPVVLDPATILLLLLGLHWWAMGVRQFQQPGFSETRMLLFHLGGLCLALALVIGMHLPLIDQPLALFLSAVVVLWCWLRGMTRTRANRRAEHMKTVFQRAFFVMLAVVVLAALVPSIATQLLAPLTLALPLFFLSGLVLFAPLLTPLANGYRLLNAFLTALFQEKPQQPLRLPKMIKLSKHVPPSPFHTSVLVVILALIGFVALGLILVLVIRIWYSNYHYTREDEIRQSIALHAVRKERQQKRAASAREQLDPTSVRAHYREFLLLMARQGTSLERLSHETPGEYQKRLHRLLESLPRQQQERFPDVILDELTRAYMQERYGGKRLDDHPYTYWHTHIRVFVKRFRRRARKRDRLSIEEG